MVSLNVIHKLQCAFADTPNMCCILWLTSLAFRLAFDQLVLKNCIILALSNSLLVTLCRHVVGLLSLLCSLGPL